MAVLFHEYELLTTSDLFDPVFYLGSNPDIAALNIDPAVHYLEKGAREGLDPSAHFDTSYYLEQCRTLGEAPVNALVHYLTSGAQRGLRTQAIGRPKQGAVGTRGVRVDAAALQHFYDPPQLMWCVDVPRTVAGMAQAPIRGGLSIVGWGFAPEGVATVDIAIDGQRVARARYGLRRPDVVAAHPSWAGAMLSGYAAHLPPQMLDVGVHRVTVELRDRQERLVSTEFQIQVQELTDGQGPGWLRRGIAQAEVDFQMGLLEALGWRPEFRVLLPLADGSGAWGEARRTLHSLSRQTYGNWQLCLMNTAGHGRSSPGQRKALPTQLIQEFEELAGRVTFYDGGGAGRAARRKTTRLKVPQGPRSFIVRLSPGDELGCDALLELAVGSAFAPEADFLYCDERRRSPVDGRPDAFFKPGWSPDLLLSTNYIGRGWCADTRLIERAGWSAAQLRQLSDYHMTLRLTELAQRIVHVPKVLLQTIGEGDDERQEREALTAALRRRKSPGEVRPGAVPGHYRIKRRLRSGRVSIVIPTCAAEARIETCLNTLRAHTAYRDYEIICIENIPPERRQWKRWLRDHAEVVIETREGFNWSRYNNLAAARASGDYLLFLNDDVEIIDSEWLGALVEQGQRPEIGVVGPLLLYPDRSVQHAGVMLDDAGRGRHAFRHLSERDAGYFGLALTQRNVVSVTGACLLTRRVTFAALGGFDEAHAVINNDLDYCLRAWSRGLLNVYTPHARLVHHELVSRGGLPEEYDAARFKARWRQVVAAGDPYFNPNLSRDHEHFTLEREPVEAIYAGPRFARSSIRRILVVKLDHIGDCITALPALHRLKQHFPQARIAVLAGRATLAIWKADAAVDETIELNVFHPQSGLGKLEVSAADRQVLAQDLRARRFDLAIDLRKQPDARWVLQLSGAAVLAGFDHQGHFPWLDVALEWDEDVPLRVKHGHVADDLVCLVEAVVAHSDQERRATIDAPEVVMSLPESNRQRLFSRPLICVHPAAGSVMRQWPAARFAELIQLLVDAGDINLAVVGGPEEGELAAEVLHGIDRPDQVFNLVGKLSLAELPTLLSAAALFVGNNSGPHHLAAALGVPTIGIHSGVVDSSEWAPLGPRAIAVRRQMSCSPCYIEHAEDCPRALACLEGLSAGQVYGNCRRLLRTARPAKSGFSGTTSRAAPA